MSSYHQNRKKNSNEYGERYEWIEKSNSTSTVRRKSNKSQYRIQMTKDLKHLTKRCGCGDFRARNRTSVPESGEEADDEESAWSQFSPRSPPTLPGGLTTGAEDEDVQSLVNVGKAVPTTSQTSEVGRDPSPRSEGRGKCHPKLPVAKPCVNVKLGRGGVPQQQTLGKRVDKTLSLPSAQIRRSVDKVQVPCVSQSARSSSHKQDSPGSRDSGSSDLSAGRNTSADTWNCHRRYPYDSAPLLELENAVVYEQGDQPSTTVTFKGHVPADLLNNIFFGRRREKEYSCPCWPQYDVDRHMGCAARSGPGHVLLRSALSEHGRKSSRESAQLSASDVCVDYAAASLLRRASQPDQRQRAATLVRFRSEPSRERPHRANSPALRRASEEAPRRPVSVDKKVHDNKRRIIIQ